MEYIYLKNNQFEQSISYQLAASCSTDSPCGIDICWLNHCIIDLF